MYLTPLLARKYTITEKKKTFKCRLTKDCFDNLTQFNKAFFEAQQFIFHCSGLSNQLIVRSSAMSRQRRNKTRKSKKQQEKLHLFQKLLALVCISQIHCYSSLVTSAPCVASPLRALQNMITLFPVQPVHNLSPAELRQRIGKVILGYRGK